MMNFKEIIADYKRNSNHKHCFYHNHKDCTKKIKKAHSIQKEKILVQLEKEINGNRMLYSLNSTSADENLSTNGLIPIGKKKASIFTGFCDYHDSKLFSPIENFDFNFSDEHLFLLTYRSFAHSFQQIIEIYKYYNSNGDFVKTFPKQYLKEHIQFTEKRIKELLLYKKVLDNIIQTKDYSALNYHTRVIEPFVPIASSTILSPTYSYKNEYLYPNEKESNVILNVLPDNNRTIIILSHFEKDTKGKILFNELADLSINDFTKAISSLMIYCTTNTFFSPSLWDNYTKEEKKQLFKEIDFCIRFGGSIKKFFISKIDFFRIKITAPNTS
ncbi:hypothetical protein Lupro_02665 [Lutibacter profundi]|uniref:Uncharacterized protein n=1 Tax=Lutibacter profundi TaxID=1622118 RepID=A0A0X8G551_9FLAO|nr:hypothetical protein [Lutibacter profundi]AMC10220.1 hypothetical protein Lupro_02665 [Lutibacter profundi]